MRGWIACAALIAATPAAADIQATRTLRVGTVLAAADLRATDGEDLTAVIGLEVRRAIYAGRPVAPDDLGPATIVRRNSVVTMEYRSGSLGMRTEGRALESGGMGEVVRVINVTSRQPVQATIIGQDRVEVLR